MVRLFLIFISLFISSNVIAETFCEALSSEIKNRQIVDRLDLSPLDFNGNNSLGINFDFYLNDLENWVLKRDQDGNPIVFNVTLKNGDGKEFEAAKYLKHGDRIISINNQLLKNLDLTQINKIFYPERIEKQDGKSKKTKISYLNQYDKTAMDIKSEEINTLYDGQLRIWPSVIIDHFKEIHPKTNKFELAYTFDYRWEDYRISNIITEIRERFNINDNYDPIGICTFNKTEFNSLNIWSPKLAFKNKVEQSFDLVEEFYEIHNYPNGYDNDGNPTSDIIFFSQGTALFQGNFNFKAFPVDRQVLTLQLFNKGDEIPMREDWLVEEWEDDLIKDLKLLNWSIKDAYISSSVESDKYWGEDKTIYNLNITIDRNYIYYIFKVYFPALIIITLAFMSLFIHPQYVEARLTVTIVSFLSLTAYSYIIDQDLPKLGYSSLIDNLTVILYLVAAVPSVIAIFTSYPFAMSKLNYYLRDKKTIEANEKYRAVQHLESFALSSKLEIKLLLLIGILFPLLGLIAFSEIISEPDIAQMSWYFLYLGFFSPFLIIYFLMFLKATSDNKKIHMIKRRWPFTNNHNH
ncbi:hypothetical protein N9T64_00660 [Pelagibacteraceae bacterium]|nr:hypothetical protein [Pelagibacteraceae bacterium]